jgi:hypothetical protein
MLQVYCHEFPTDIIMFKWKYKNIVYTKMLLLQTVSNFSQWSHWLKFYIQKAMGLPLEMFAVILIAKSFW